LEWALLIHRYSTYTAHLFESLGFLKDTKFYLENKVPSIHTSGIVTFKPFLIAGRGDISLFQTVSWFKPEVLALSKIHPVQNYFAKNYHV